jgi:SPP1 gp7 family putative phage head morphogenesis protein
VALNDDILDENIKHAVGLQRLSAGVLRRVLTLLNATDADLETRIRDRLAGIDPSKVSTDVTLSNLQTLQADVRAINTQVSDRVNALLLNEGLELAKYEAEAQVDVIDKVTPVRINFNKPSVELLEAVVTKRPFQGRVLREWAQGVGAQRTQRVMDQIKIGVVEGQSVENIVKRVRGTKSMNYKDGILEISRRDAASVVKTAVTHIASGAAEVFYEANQEAIKGVRWVSVLDGRTTAVCQARDGKVFEPGKGPRPPAHFNCRSTVTPVLRSFRELGIDLDDLPDVDRKSMNGKEPAGTTYNDWLKRQSAAFQDEVLGVTKGALFRRGGLSVDRFVDASGHEYTVAELRKRERAAFEKAGLAA